MSNVIVTVNQTIDQEEVSGYLAKLGIGGINLEWSGKQTRRLRLMDDNVYGRVIVVIEPAPEGK